MFEARDGPEDAFFTSLRRDDLPTADGSWDGDGLFWFVLLDDGFDRVRGCCLNKSAYVLIVIADDARRVPVPVVWAGASGMAAAAQVAGASRNLICSPKHQKKQHSQTTLRTHHHHEPSPRHLPQTGLPSWRRLRSSVLAAGASRVGLMGLRAATSPGGAMELQLAEPANCSMERLSML
jgi:hypothetical protein